ncbi:MAG: hypothetical protein EOM19_01140 [Candidatus Moranbacteria bacterium]|nr:hypothetical protein [Candidatus Moranbacteria bacterium]
MQSKKESKNHKVLFSQGDAVEAWFAHLWKERRVDGGILFLGILTGAFFEWNIVEIFIFVVFLWSILGPLSSRILAIPALFFLSATPILLMLSREEQAETFAVYAYYFLVMAVIRAISELRSENRESMEKREKFLEN